MASDENVPTADLWSQWLLHQRHADDPRLQEAVVAVVDRYIDRVIDGAQLTAGQTLVDVGTGEGLVAFRAMERVGQSLRAWLTDVSGPMLQHARAQAEARGVLGQCSFLHCAADRLEGIDDASADCVTTRSALAYVADKIGALREFHRVLKPGGRISLAEPVFQDDAVEAKAIKAVIDSKPAQGVSPLLILLHRWKAAQFPDSAEKISASPIANYCERDLLRFAQEAGFIDLHLELHIDTGPSIVRSWDAFVHNSPHPLAPSLSRIMTEQFTVAEREYFERSMRPVIENPNAVSTDRMVYLTARKALA